MKKETNNNIYITPSSINWEEHEITKINKQIDDSNIEAAKKKQETINKAFKDYKINAECIGYTIGPSVTRLLIDYYQRGSVKDVEKMVGTISRLLNGVPVRFTETVPNTRCSAFEVPNDDRIPVTFKEVLEALPPANRYPLEIPLGKDITNKVIHIDITSSPNMLISGTTGSGKSMFLNTLISTLISRVSPQDLKLVLINPRKLEMNKYRDIPHLLCPVVNDADETELVLENLIKKMNERYDLFEESKYVTDLRDYNNWAIRNNKSPLPCIVVILDDYSDLVSVNSNIAPLVVSLAAKARASGIHLVVSTSHPSIKIITGTLKSNLITRIAFESASYIDSMIILNEGGAEDLLGGGDMLVRSPLVYRKEPVRIQGAYISNKEIEAIIQYIKSHYETHYDESFVSLEEQISIRKNEKDKIYLFIKDWVSTQEYVSISKIQRMFDIGFNRSGSYVHRLQEEGILSKESSSHNKGYKVLLDK